MALSLNMLDDSEVSGDVAEGLVGGEDSMESEVVEVLEASEEVTESEEMLDEAEEAQDNLESFREIIQADIEAGERLSPAAARHMLAHANTVFGRVGVTVSSVNTESFSSPSDSRDALLQVNMEAGGLWNKIVDFVMKLVNKVRSAMKGLWVKITDAAPAIAKRAKALAEKARKTTGTIEEKNIKIGGFSSLAIGKEVKDPKGDMDNLYTLVSNVLVRGKDNWKSRYNSIQALLDALPDQKKAIGKVSDVTTALTNLGDSYFKGITSDSTSQGIAQKVLGYEKEDAEGITCSKVMFGGRVFYTYIAGADIEVGNTEASEGKGKGKGKKDAEKAAKDLQTMPPEQQAPAAAAVLRAVNSYREGSGTDSSVEIDSDTEVPTLQTGVIVDICNKIEDTMNSVSKYRRAFDERDAAKKKTLDLLKKAQGKVDKAKDGEITGDNKRLFEGVLKSAYVLGRDEMGTHVSKYAITTSKALLGYCEKSLAQYKSK